jgi:putative methyltransferase (TIGR04325 family)
VNLKKVVKDWLPPVVLRQVQKGWRAVRNGRAVQPPDPPEWEYVPQGWEADRGNIRGWDQPGVAETYAARWEQFQKLIAGTGPLGISYEGLGGLLVDAVDIHNQVMTLAYVVGRAALGRDGLTLLDYGGALGHHRAFLQVLFPGFPLDYSCCEVPRVAAQGRRLHPQVRYFTDDSWAAQKFDVVFASNSLQYARHWQDRLAQFARAARSFVLITKLPVVQKAPSFVILQRVEKYGYGTEYLGWCLNQAEFQAAAHENQMIWEREFLVSDWEPDVVNAPERLRHKGFLFRKADAV